MAIARIELEAANFEIRKRREESDWHEGQGLCAALFRRCKARFDPNMKSEGSFWRAFIAAAGSYKYLDEYYFWSGAFSDDVHKKWKKKFESEVNGEKLDVELTAYGGKSSQSPRRIFLKIKDKDGNSPNHRIELHATGGHMWKKASDTKIIFFEERTPTREEINFYEQVIDRLRPVSENASQSAV